MQTKKHLVLVALLFLLLAPLAFTGCGSKNAMPTTTSLSPNSKTAGEGAFTLTVNGTDFMKESMVRWRGADRPTTYISETRITASIPAADLAVGGDVPVTVFNPEPGGGESTPALTFTINNPGPTTTSLSVTSKTAGEASFTLTVNGTGFTRGSVVKWNGTDRTTTFVSDTHLSLDISAADLAAAGTFQVTVFNPEPGGGISNEQTFTVNPAPPPPPQATTPPPQNSSSSGGTTVYITNTGEKYHSDGCQYLRQSKIPISLSDALSQGYSP